MIDPFGREITYLRVSVTARCDLRCVYCMSEDMSFLPKQDLLTLEELERLCSAFVARGTRKIRITGGEPLVRRGIMTLFRSLGRHLDSGALEELTVTTNGSQLARYAQELADCGVKRVNVSLDTLDADRFRAKKLTRQVRAMLDDPALTTSARRVADAFANYPAPQRMAAFLEGVRAFHRFAPSHATAGQQVAGVADGDGDAVRTNVH